MSHTQDYPRVANFGAGPATLPLPVLKSAQHDLLNYNNSGMSVLELSHRSHHYESIHADTKRQLIDLMNIPNTHSVLFLQGGGTAQFAAVPLNIGTDQNAVADYIVTGAWSKKAAQEASKYCNVNIAYSAEQSSFTRIPAPCELQFSAKPAYIYYCANETIHGVEFNYVPDTPSDVPLVVDYSSSFLSQPIDVAKFGVIFAGAQKNIGPAGVTVVIVRNSLLNRASASTPSIMNYTLMTKANSLLNTPPTFGIYVCGLSLKWLDDIGGIEYITKVNHEKATLLMNTIKRSSLYSCVVQDNACSRMNIVFRVGDVNSGLEAIFLQQAFDVGLVGLKGHRSVGGIRASLYNALPLEYVQRLVSFMQKFESTQCRERS